MGGALQALLLRCCIGAFFLLPSIIGAQMEVGETELELLSADTLVQTVDTVLAVVPFNDYASVGHGDSTVDIGDSLEGNSLLTDGELKTLFFRTTGESQGRFVFTFPHEKAVTIQRLGFGTFTDYALETGRYSLLLDGENTHELSSKVRLGFEWIPSFYSARYNYPVDTFSTIDSGFGSLSFSVGPVAMFDFAGVQVRLSGGGALDVWNEQLQYKLSESSAAGTEVDGGGYVSLRVGGVDKPLLSTIPLYGNGSIFGRYMQGGESSNFTRGDVLVGYYADSVLGADSLIITVGDTLLHGRVGGVYAYSSGGKDGDTPSRVNNGFATSMALLNMGRGSWFLTPSILLSLYDNRYRYLSPETHSGLLSPRSRTRFSGTLDMYKTWQEHFTLAGGFVVGVGQDEYFYLESFGGYQSGGVLGASQIDSATVKLNDEELWYPEAYVTFAMDALNNWSAGYRYSIQRDRHLYPFYYVSSGDTVTSLDDMDNGRQFHRLYTTYQWRPSYSVGVSAEYQLNQIYFLNPSRSGGSRIDRRVKFDLLQTFSVPSRFTGELVLGALVTPQEYVYSTYAPSKPSHSRRFYALSKGDISYEKGWGTFFRCDYYYRDMGLLTGEYYGISQKIYELTGELAVHKQFAKAGEWRLGSDMKRQSIAHWNDAENDWVNWVEDTITTIDSQYVERSEAVVYQFAPYLLAKLHLPRGVYLQGRVKHYIDILARETENYWDLGLTLTVEM